MFRYQGLVIFNMLLSIYFGSYELIDTNCSSNYMRFHEIGGIIFVALLYTISIINNYEKSKVPYLNPCWALTTMFPFLLYSLIPWDGPVVSSWLCPG